MQKSEAESPDIIAMRRWKQDDIKDMEGELLFKQISFKDKEDAILSRALQGRPKTVRVQVKKTWWGTSFVATMDVQNKDDVAFLKGVIDTLKSKWFKKPIKKKKEGENHD
jgi:hypothetical protein